MNPKQNKTNQQKANEITKEIKQKMLIYVQRFLQDTK